MTRGLEKHQKFKEKYNPPVAKIAPQQGNLVAQKKRYRYVLEGITNAGKTYFWIHAVEHNTKNLKPEEVLAYCIDADLGGCSEEISTIDPKLQDSFWITQVHTMREIEAAIQDGVKRLTEHKKKHPNGYRALIFENLEMMKQYTSNSYALEMHGMEEKELAFMRQMEARESNKAMLPIFPEGQMSAYGTINRWFISYVTNAIRQIKDGDYDFFATCLLEPEFETRDGERIKTGRMVRQGKPDRNDHFFDRKLRFVHYPPGSTYRLRDDMKDKQRTTEKDMYYMIVRDGRIPKFDLVDVTPERFFLELERLQGGKPPEPPKQPPKPPEKAPVAKEKAKVEAPKKNTDYGF